MSLRDGGSKMSKSDPSDNSRINLTDNAEMIEKKIKKAKTDGGMMPEAVDEMEARPEVKNLIGIYAALSGRTDADIVKNYAGKGFGVFKPDLADLAVESLAPVTDLMNRYLADPDELDRILAAAGDKAAEIADPIVADVRRVIGFTGA